MPVKELLAGVRQVVTTRVCESCGLTFLAKRGSRKNLCAKCERALTR